VKASVEGVKRRRRRVKDLLNQGPGRATVSGVPSTRILCFTGRALEFVES